MAAIAAGVGAMLCISSSVAAVMMGGGDGDDSAAGAGAGAGAGTDAPDETFTIPQTLIPHPNAMLRGIQTFVLHFVLIKRKLRLTTQPIPQMVPKPETIPALYQMQRHNATLIATQRYKHMRVLISN